MFNNHVDLDTLEILRNSNENIGGKCPVCFTRNVEWKLLRTQGKFKVFHGICKECKCEFDINAL